MSLGRFFLRPILPPKVLVISLGRSLMTLTLKLSVLFIDVGISNGAVACSDIDPSYPNSYAEGLVKGDWSAL
jgi:hypothetical protein